MVVVDHREQRETGSRWEARDRGKSGENEFRTRCCQHEKVRKKMQFELLIVFLRRGSIVQILFIELVYIITELIVQCIDDSRILVYYHRISTKTDASDILR
jgi:hypothetical protein